MLLTFIMMARKVEHCLPPEALGEESGLAAIRFEQGITGYAPGHGSHANSTLFYLGPIQALVKTQKTRRECCLIIQLSLILRSPSQATLPPRLGIMPPWALRVSPEIGSSFPEAVFACNILALLITSSGQDTLLVRLLLLMHKAQAKRTTATAAEKSMPIRIRGTVKRAQHANIE